MTLIKRRRTFDNVVKFAEITNVDKDLIKNLKLFYGR